MPIENRAAPSHPCTQATWPTVPWTFGDMGSPREASWTVKTVWASPAGKKRLSERLAALLPSHSTYVEPFAGSAAVFFAKVPAKVEVISDADPEIAQAYRDLKSLTARDLQQLRTLTWTGSATTYRRLLASKPTTKLPRLHRFLYLSHFSYGRLRGKSFNPGAEGIRARTLDRIETFLPRLRPVTVEGGDYEAVVRKYDSPQTAFFFDPPYVGYDVAVGEKAFDEERFFRVLTSLRGHFVLTYGVRGKLPALLRRTSFTIQTIRTPRPIRSMRGVGGPTTLTQLLVQGGPRPRRSAKGESAPDEEGEWTTFRHAMPLVQGLDPNDERYVLGVVLEPETLDAQGDVYSAEEVRRAAHGFMESLGSLGLQHRVRVEGDVRVLESFLAPTDLRWGTTSVRQGTWLLALRIVADALWDQVNTGALTGLSIGGTARRIRAEAA